MIVDIETMMPPTIPVLPSGFSSEQTEPFLCSLSVHLFHHNALRKLLTHCKPSLPNLSMQNFNSHFLIEFTSPRDMKNIPVSYFTFLVLRIYMVLHYCSIDTDVAESCGAASIRSSRAFVCQRLYRKHTNISTSHYFHPNNNAELV